MATGQNSPNDQPDEVTPGTPGMGTSHSPNARTAGTSAGHTTAGAGTGADVTDLITDGDGSADGDINADTGTAEIGGGGNTRAG